MKKFLTSLTFILLLSLLVTLCACGEKSNEENTGNVVKIKAVEDFESYKIVRSETSTEAETAALVKLNKEIKSQLNVLLKVSTDYTTATKEILIGNTKREQSIAAAKGLKYNDYVIKHDGNKIVIVGGSDAATTAAVDFFIENFISTEDKCLKVPTGDGLVYIREYKLNTFTVGGVDISEFYLKSLYDTEGIDQLRDDILNKYVGAPLQIEENEMLDDRHYIVLDNSGLDYDDYSISVKDGNLYISGSYASFGSALSEFYKMMDNAANKTIILGDSETISGKLELPKIPYENKEELLEILEYLQEDDRLIFGQHLAGSMDLNTSIDQYTEAVGEGPAIMDIDMLNLRKHSKATWGKLICQAVEYAAKGGVITTMHHWLNPLHPDQGYRGRLDSLDQWQEVLTPGTELNKAWHEELDRGAEFLKALDDAGVSVMFRPMHEANGNWFWFCAGYGDLGYIDSRDMISMWKYVYEYYTEDWELDNLLWSYAPNVSNSTVNPVTYYYPGDEYCDVVGLDWYTDGSYEIDGNGKSWDNLLDYRKPTGLTEWGIGNALRAEDPAQQSSLWNCEDYVRTLEQMRMEGKSIAFAEVYSERFGAPSYVGKGEALANYELIISLEEMPAFINEVLGK